MKLTKKADYALRAVYYITRLPEDKLASIGEIADRQGAPREFLAKILKQLTRAGILKSFQGIKGGYQLSRPPAQISFLDIIEAVEGPILLNQCCKSDPGCCELFDSCDMRHFWREQQEVYVRRLASETMDRYLLETGVRTEQSAVSVA